MAPYLHHCLDSSGKAGNYEANSAGNFFWAGMESVQV
jgi:hypothetical protein